MIHTSIHRNGVASSPDVVVCPKPRRVGLLNGTIHDPSRALRWRVGYQADFSDAKAGSELLDIVLAKGGGHGGAERIGASSAQQVASPPPFFCGSPPSRVSNPLIQDARFKEEKFPPMSSSPSSSSPTSTAARKGGACVRANFGNNPAVRIEGFDCLDRDRRNNCSIPALA